MLLKPDKIEPFLKLLTLELPHNLNGKRMTDCLNANKLRWVELAMVRVVIKLLTLDKRLKTRV